MRKIGEKLLERLVSGNLQSLLKCIKNDSSLRLEVRRDNNAFVYYKKGKALEIKCLKVDDKYGNIPDTKLAETNPCEYFSLIKKSIDMWLEQNKSRNEFETQQNIAQNNQDEDDKYILLDMEYNFEQSEIIKEDREKRAGFDLIGIERETNKVIVFELKNGMDATNGKSGIEEHIKDFKTFFYGKNSEFFKSNLTKDIKNIVNDKNKLQLLANFQLSDNFEVGDVEFIFILHPQKSSDIQEFEKKLDNRYKLLLVDESNYKLK